MMPNTVVLHCRSNSDAEQDSYPVRLGRGIAAMRERRQLSRKALANRLRVSTNRLGYWERGVNLPPGDKTIELLRELEVTPDELLAAGEEETSTDPRAMEAPGQLERRRTMSDETMPVVTVEPDLMGTEDPDLKSERVQEG